MFKLGLFEIVSIVSVLGIVIVVILLVANRNMDK